ncbi:MAG: NifU family protein [Lutibacter sp.]|uniref:NifU family protein n=1 Tax=Lutibacter sp. TaxID=1925666 RepID=UPI00179A17A2|nr:NifU family protein [Lutibacter sp.]MBT8316373.1 NifU family protein [Lutibacter sp.]NNJ57233.1 NifU family protein [Lutibacter sp.]
MEKITLKIEKTTSESIIKFTANTVLISGSYEFNTIDEAKNSPLAQQLFHLPFIKRVFISANFIAVEKFDIVEWNDVQEEVKEQIEHYLNNPGVLVLEETNSPQQKIPVEVYAESTPNPSVLKFVANKNLVETDFEFKNKEEAKNSPLALNLFDFKYVKEVFISENYVSVSKTEAIDWGEITVELRSFIREYIANGGKIINENYKQEKNSQTAASETANLDDVSKQVIDLLDQYVKPAVAADGGNIAFQSYDETTQTVNVILQGACSGCPSSTVTLKNGIENMLKQLIPGKISQVVAINL